MRLAPIVLFTYNRLWHAQQTIEALQKNELARDSEIFIFSDGAKKEEDIPQVQQVRKYLRTIKGFKKIEIIERNKNLGLTNNIIDGVTRIVNEYGKIIVLEDDLETSPYFLKFMNEALERYEKKERVMSVTGYMFPIRSEGLPETFFLKLASSWSWATWDRAWKYFERNPEKQIKMLNKKQIRDFNLDNSYDFWRQMILNHKGKLHTWGIFWYFAIYINNGLTLFPRESLVQNIGHDASGTHCGKTDMFMVKLSLKSSWKFPQVIEEDLLARERVVEFFKLNSFLWRRSLYKAILEKIKMIIRLNF